MPLSISEPEIPHTFSVYDLKNASYSRLPKRVVTQSSNVFGSRERSRAIPQVRGGAQRGLDDAEPGDDVRRLQGVREVLAVVVDAGEARPDEELLAERRLPEALDRRKLGEEPVAAEVEAVPVAFHGLREATDDPVGLEHRPSLAAQSQHVGGGQPGRARAEHGVSVRRIVEIGPLVQATESTSPR